MRLVKGLVLLVVFLGALLWVFQESAERQEREEEVRASFCLKATGVPQHVLRSPGWGDSWFYCVKPDGTLVLARDPVRE